MKLNAYCDYFTDNTCFVLNKKNQITFFDIHSTTKTGHFLIKKPVLGDLYHEIIVPAYAAAFSRLVNTCFKGKSIHIEKRFQVKGAGEIELQVILSPVLSDPDNPLVVCTVISSNRKSNQMKLLDEYAHLASHDLRAPITNILSLSSLLNFADPGTYDMEKIRELLRNINLQAEKLDDIIRMLNRMIDAGQDKVFAAGTSRSGYAHIVLVDDDPVTNKIHHLVITKHQKNRRVVPFEHPEEALEYLALQEPDLVLLDLNMPGISGWDFLQLMEKKGIAIDVVIISSSINAADRIRAQAFKAVKDFITKPLTYEKIRHLLDE